MMNKFYEAAINVLVHEDTFIDKLVGDEVTTLFIPGYAGKMHAQSAVRAGKKLLEVTGHGKGSRSRNSYRDGLGRIYRWGQG